MSVALAALAIVSLVFAALLFVIGNDAAGAARVGEHSDLDERLARQLGAYDAARVVGEAFLGALKLSAVLGIAALGAFLFARRARTAAAPPTDPAAR